MELQEVLSQHETNEKDKKRKLFKIEWEKLEFGNGSVTIDNFLSIFVYFYCSLLTDITQL